MTLKDTIVQMCDDNYKTRLWAEYWQTKIRYEKLKAYCNEIEVAELLEKEGPPHDCPVDLLRDQQYYMGQYLSALEKRAIIEHVDLGMEA